MYIRPCHDTSISASIVQSKGICPKESSWHLRSSLAHRGLMLLLCLVTLQLQGRCVSCWQCSSRGRAMARQYYISLVQLVIVSGACIVTGNRSASTIPPQSFRGQGIASLVLCFNRLRVRCSKAEKGLKRLCYNPMWSQTSDLMSSGALFTATPEKPSTEGQ